MGPVGRPELEDRDACGRLPRFPRTIAPVLTDRAVNADRLSCEAVAVYYRLALFLSRGPAIALSVLLPMLVAVSAIGTVGR